WWIFALVGGWLTVRFGEPLLAVRLGLPMTPDGEYASGVSKWLAWAVTAGGFAPGALAGGLGGWGVIRPGKAGLGGLVRGFNRVCDRAPQLYGWAVGKVLRLCAIVLVLYGGLLGLTYWGFSKLPTGYIPPQDKGYLLVSVQLPDS